MVHAHRVHLNERTGVTNRDNCFSLTPVGTPLFDEPETFDQKALQAASKEAEMHTSSEQFAASL